MYTVENLFSYMLSFVYDLTTDVLRAWSEMHVTRGKTFIKWFMLSNVSLEGTRLAPGSDCALTY